MDKTVYIVGHKNPDTDSVVSAVAYARLKELLGEKNCIASRAGHLNPQTDYIFNKFQVPHPKYLSNLTPKVQHYLKPLSGSVNKSVSVWDAINKMQELHNRVIPVVDDEGRYDSLLHFSAFAQNVITLLNPEKKHAISTSIGLIQKTLHAQPIVVHNEDEIFKGSILVGAAHTHSFAEKLREHASENIIVITSDRESIHQLCVDSRIKLLILSSDYVMKKELRELAQKNGVSVLISPYPVAATSMMIAYSTPVSIMSDSEIKPVLLSDTITKIRPLLQASPCRCLPVVDEDNKIVGIISETDLMGEPNTEVILVDHNEITQALDGIENFKIREVIDHHRLSPLSTKYPITFINKPVGSTSTIITNLYKEYRVPVPKDIASLLLCGILSDTLILQSTTTTETDRETAEYLSNITNLEIEVIGKEILEAGSHINGRSATDVIHQDMKEYTEGKLSYTVSQIEVGNTAEILDRKDEFFKELEFERRGRNLVFAALLVTDITKLSSILLIDADEKFAPYITFPKLENQVYYLKDVVSRKKQLVPLLTEQLAVLE